MNVIEQFFLSARVVNALTGDNAGFQRRRERWTFTLKRFMGEWCYFSGDGIPLNSSRPTVFFP